jgi:hypothetical protein
LYVRSNLETPTANTPNSINASTPLPESATAPDNVAPPNTATPVPVIPDTDTLKRKAKELAAYADLVCVPSSEHAQPRAGENNDVPMHDNDDAPAVLQPNEEPVAKPPFDEKKCADATYDSDMADLAVNNRASDPRSLTVDMAITVTSTNPLRIKGTTNLPEGTELGGFLVGQPPECTPHTPRCGNVFNFTTVKDGSFTAVAEMGGVQTAATYTIEFGTSGTPTGGSGVSAALGERGEHLRGPYVVTLGPGGKYISVDFEQPRALSDFEKLVGYIINYTQRVEFTADGGVHRVACPGYSFEDTLHGKAAGVGCGE